MADIAEGFIMIDGIAGSGKTTLIESVKESALNKSLKVFDLKHWSLQNSEPPFFEQVLDNDVFFTFEPTRSWIGSAIRFELARTDSPYAGDEIASAFSIDRHIMYKRLIIPALESGKIVVQDRGFTTSVIYQPIMASGMPINKIMALPGNQLAVKYAPGPRMQFEGENSKRESLRKKL